MEQITTGIMNDPPDQYIIFHLRYSCFTGFLKVGTDGWTCVKIAIITRNNCVLAQRIKILKSFDLSHPLHVTK